MSYINTVCDRCGLPIGTGAIHVTYRSGLPAVIEHTDCALGPARAPAPIVRAAAVSAPNRNATGSPPTGRLP